MCGGRELVGADGYVSDKSITNDELKGLISSELWKKGGKEDKKKAKKWYLFNPLFNW